MTKDQPLSAEQRARDLLERMEVQDAQEYSFGELVELANLIVDHDALSARLAQVEHFCIRCHHRWTGDAGVRSEYCGDCHRAFDNREKLLKRYLDNHCQLADQEGMSTLCECKLCLDTRKEIGL